MSAEILDVYTITDKKKGDKAWWTRIGMACVNRDKSINVYLDAVPINGRLQIRERQLAQKTVQNHERSVA